MLYFGNSKSAEILKHFYRPLKRARLQVLCPSWLNDAGSLTFSDRKRKNRDSPVCYLNGLSFFWRTRCWFFFLSSSVWPRGCPVCPSRWKSDERVLFWTTLCIFQLSWITFSFPLLGSAPPFWSAEVLLCFQSGMKSHPDASGFISGHRGAE